MRTAPVSRVPNLGTLKNISWLTKRQLQELARTLTLSSFNRRSVIYEEGNSPESAYFLLSGVARITCRNRKGQRAVVMMVAPGMIPGFPPAAPGINYNFRCEAVTACHIGTVDFEAFIKISLGIAATDFKRLAVTYLGRWLLAQLRCSNFMSCTLAERLALTLLELAEHFGVSDPRGLRLAAATTHKDLADLVGASRPRVTEYLIEFERKHMIVRANRQLTVKRDGLETFLSQAHSSL
jgi:CRP/FNR family transcriptional regulator